MDSKNLNNTNPKGETETLFAEPESKPQKKGSGKASSLIIGLVIGAALTSIIACCLMMNGGKSLSKIEGPGYSSPEKAVEAYVNYLKEGNLEGAVSTFAVESYVDNFDMTEYYKWIKAYNGASTNGPQIFNGFYFDSNMSRDLNIESRRAYIIKNMAIQLQRIIINTSDNVDLSFSALTYSTYSFIDDPDYAEDVIDFLSTDPELDSIEIGDYLDIDDFDISEDSIENQIEHEAEIWNSDIEQVIVELEINDEDYTLFMLCVRYNNKWYIADFNNVAGLSLGIAATQGLIPDDNFKYY